MKKTICLIGAGNIGSRHLQGLKKVPLELDILVIDPSGEALSISKDRYMAISSPLKHKISFAQDFNVLPKDIDLAIIATSSNIRAQVIKKLLSRSQVQYLILEKILFQKREDYNKIEQLLKKSNSKAWVNFSMRTIPFYYQLKDNFSNTAVQMIVSGSQYGLVTNVIHFIDYLAFLTNCYEFKLETAGLSIQPIPSKRLGFLELTGTLNIHFQNGSSASYTCYPDGDAPFIIELFYNNFRCISKESEKKAWVADSKNQWLWKEIDTHIPYQSEMTNLVVDKLLADGTTTLTPFSEALKTHLILLDSLLEFLNINTGKKFDYYPFT